VAELLDPSHPATEVPRQRGPHPTAAAAATGSLTVVTLGQEEIRLDGRSLAPADFSYAKPRELLYLLLETSSATKSDIGLALWPDTSSVELRSAFHTTLHHLRRAVGGSRVRYRNGRYEVDRERLRYDVNEFTTTLAAARSAGDKHEEVRLLRAATDLYGGDYLPNTDPAWAGERRAEVKHRFERALLALGRRLAEVGHHATAVEVLRRAVTSDPLMETAHRELMRAYAQLGEPSRAVRQYDTLTASLRDELGTSPAAETVQTYREIRLVPSV
jgi:two-component SAPR family response regulator